MKKNYDDLLALKDQQKLKKVFFFRVCGTGMGAAACLLKEAGFEVEGGDHNFYPPMSDYLENAGVELQKLKEVSKEYLKSFDLIVVGNVVPRGSDDALLIEGLGVPYCSFPTALGALVLNQYPKVVGIAGTHGKTTTTYFFQQVFEKLGEDAGYLIGGVLNDKPSAHLGKSPYFFIESDEYDSSYFEKISKFRSYSINDLILTSLEFDHADIFNSIEDIKHEFSCLLKTLKSKVIFNDSYKASCELKETFSELEWIEFANHDHLKIIEKSSNGTQFQVTFKGKGYLFKTNIIGMHNILNLASVIIYALSEGIDEHKLYKACEVLQHVKRRQEIRGVIEQAVIIDDFAHHPTSVHYTLDSIRQKFPDRKLVVVFEPNSATARSSLFQNEFQNALEIADEIYLAKPARKTSVKNAEDFDSFFVSQELSKKGKKSAVVENLEQLLDNIIQSSKEKSVVTVLSNGTCLDLWKSEFIKKLRPYS